MLKNPFVEKIMKKTVLALGLGALMLAGCGKKEEENKAPSATEAPKAEEQKPMEAPKAEEQKAPEAPKAEEQKPMEAPKAEEQKPAEEAPAAPAAPEEKK